MADILPAKGPATRAAITGVGLATPLGTTVEQTWESLLAGRYINEHALVPIDCGDPRQRIFTLSTRVAREAIASAPWGVRELRDDRTSLIVGTSKGPVQSWLTPPLHMSCDTYVVGGLDPTGLAEIAAVLAGQLQLGSGPRITISAACASGVVALARGAIMIQSREADRVLVVAAESSLHPLFLASFQRLGVLPRSGLGCRPFDKYRDGFLMSEAATAVCLEPEIPGRDAQIVIGRTALVGDAHHLTAADPSGSALRHLLCRVIDGQRVDLIHAHGTGTMSSDPIELAAIESILHHREPPPLVYSHKGALGHSLGAAGLVSVAINCMAHRNGIVPGNVQTTRPLPTTGCVLPAGRTQRIIKRSIAFASGFGGAMAAIALENA